MITFEVEKEQLLTEQENNVVGLNYNPVREFDPENQSYICVDCIDGLDTNDGKFDAPVKTIDKAIELAQSSGYNNIFLIRQGIYYAHFHDCSSHKYFSTDINTFARIFLYGKSKLFSDIYGMDIFEENIYFFDDNYIYQNDTGTQESNPGERMLKLKTQIGRRNASSTKYNNIACAYQNGNVLVRASDNKWYQRNATTFSNCKDFTLEWYDETNNVYSIALVDGDKVRFCRNENTSFYERDHDLNQPVCVENFYGTCYIGCWDGIYARNFYNSKDKSLCTKPSKVFYKSAINCLQSYYDPNDSSNDRLYIGTGHGTIYEYNPFTNIFTYVNKIPEIVKGICRAYKSDFIDVLYAVGTKNNAYRLDYTIKNKVYLWSKQVKILKYMFKSIMDMTCQPWTITKDNYLAKETEHFIFDSRVSFNYIDFDPNPAHYHSGFLLLNGDNFFNHCRLINLSSSIYTQDATGIEINNTIICNNGWGFVNAYISTTTVSSKIRNSLIYKNKYSALRMLAQNIVVENCTIAYNKNGVVILFDENVTSVNVEVQYNIIFFNSGYGIHCDTDYDSDFTVNNNIVSYNNVNTFNLIENNIIELHPLFVSTKNYDFHLMHKDVIRNDGRRFPFNSPAIQESGRDWGCYDIIRNAVSIADLSIQIDSPTNLKFNNLADPEEAKLSIDSTPHLLMAEKTLLQLDMNWDENQFDYNKLYPLLNIIMSGKRLKLLFENLIDSMSNSAQLIHIHEIGSLYGYEIQYIFERLGIIECYCVYDSDKSWQINQWKGFIAKVTVESNDYFVKIIANNANHLFFIEEIEGETCSYAILYFRCILKSTNVAFEQPFQGYMDNNVPNTGLELSVIEA